jgi:hypothetical protein
MILAVRLDSRNTVVSPPRPRAKPVVGHVWFDHRHPDGRPTPVRHGDLRRPRATAAPHGPRRAAAPVA